MPFKFVGVFRTVLWGDTFLRPARDLGRRKHRHLQNLIPRPKSLGISARIKPGVLDSRIKARVSQHNPCATLLNRSTREPEIPNSQPYADSDF